MSVKKRPSATEISDEDIAEIERANLRRQSEEALFQLYELAKVPNPRASGAASSLVGAAMHACELVRAAAKTNPGVFSGMAKSMTRWPVVYSAFPGDKRGLADYLAALQLSADAPLNLRKWGLHAPGTRWAYAYWSSVQRCKAHQRLMDELSRPDTHLRGDRIDLFDGGDALRTDYEEAVALPALNLLPANLKRWRDSFERHVQRHFPGRSVVEHSDWKHLARYRGADEKWCFGKFLGEVARGFQRIAKRAEPA